MLSDQMRQILEQHRKNDVKVEVMGTAVPIKDLVYDPLGDQLTIILDEDAEDFKIMLTEFDLPTDDVGAHREWMETVILMRWGPEALAELRERLSPENVRAARERIKARARAKVDDQ